MSDSFREQVDIKATIRGILAGYPFSVGLFRELLQNADDAGATKQVSHCRLLDVISKRNCLDA